MPNASCRVSLSLQDKDRSFLVYTDPPNTVQQHAETIFAVLSNASWNHVELRLERAGKVKVKLKVNGIPVSIPDTVGIDPCILEPRFAVTLGTFASSITTTSHEAWFDNVRVDAL